MLLIEAVTDVKRVPICIFIFNCRDSTMRPADESSTLSVQSSAAADNNRDVFLQLIRPSTSCCTTLCVSHSFISANYSLGNYFPAHIRSFTKRAEHEKAKHGPAYFFSDSTGGEMCSHVQNYIWIDDDFGGKNARHNGIILFSSHHLVLVHVMWL